MYASVSGRAMSSTPDVWSGDMSLEMDMLPMDAESGVKRFSARDGTRLPGFGGRLFRKKQSLGGVGRGSG